MMMFGQENNLPIDVMAGIPPESKPNITCIEYVEWLRTILNGVYQYANDQLKVNAQRQQYYYGIRVKPHEYMTGTYVWRWYPPAAKGKLAKGCRRDHIEMSFPTPLHALLRAEPEGMEIRVHIDTLQPYNGISWTFGRIMWSR